MAEIVEAIWERGFQVAGFDFDVRSNKLNLPGMLPTSYLHTFSSWFSARMMQCVGKQACSMLKAAVKKRAKQLFMLKELQKEGKSTKYLQRKIDTRPLVKPSTHNCKAELDPRFVDFQQGVHFDLFVRVKQLGAGRSFCLPLKETKVSRKWASKGKRKASIRLSEHSLVLFYEVKKAAQAGSRTVGADQGYRSVLSFSDGQVTTPCPHGHDLVSIQEKLSRRRKGTKGFRRAQEHRKNYTHWSLNQLCFEQMKCVRLEKIYRLRDGMTVSRVMSHWSYKQIKNKLISLGETKGFRLEEVPNEFRSQRCSQCGWVRKANRKGKTFKCTNCGFFADADLNAASNLALELFELPYWVRLEKINRRGFFWTSDGFFDSDHEPIVRGTNKAKK